VSGWLPSPRIFVAALTVSPDVCGRNWPKTRVRVAGCTGRVYGQRGEPAVLVRITGVAPLLAQVYELERLRCGLCGTVFTADPPPGVGKAKYDDTAAAMIALLKYACGLPFHRIERLEQGLAIPMPVGTQWEVVAAAAAPLIPVFDELARQAAQGTVVYNDDTTMRILTLTQEARAEALPAGASADRTGVFTSGVVAETPNGLIALFKTGPCHAGEHLAEVLDLREVTDPPIHMSDASTRNRPGDHSTLAASCIPHARRNTVDVVEAFPEEVAFVLHTLRAVFHTDAQAKPAVALRRSVPFNVRPAVSSPCQGHPRWFPPARRPIERAGVDAQATRR
jgi:transposase